MGFFSDEPLDELVDQLHQRSEDEAEALTRYFVERGESSGLTTKLDSASHEFLATKMVALEVDKAQFCHRLCCAIGAQNIVEVGTSHGVSTLYLADAVRANGGGRVIATEYEPDKASMARQHFKLAGLDDLIELREGDLRDTLGYIDLSLDFVLIDIWMEKVRLSCETSSPPKRHTDVQTEFERHIHSIKLAFVFGFHSQQVMNSVLRISNNSIDFLDSSLARIRRF